MHMVSVHIQFCNFTSLLIGNSTQTIAIVMIYEIYSLLLAAAVSFSGVTQPQSNNLLPLTFNRQSL